MGRGKQRSQVTNPRWQWPTGDEEAPGLAEFKTACYEVARQTGGRVESASKGRFPPNFHRVVIAFRDRRVAVLCHQTLSLLALATPPVESSIWPLSFIDDPAIGPAIAALVRVRLLTAAELELDWSRAATRPPAEVAYEEDLKYWRPGSVGEVIFNGWD
ncbi:hypothetical protein [Streptomyces collinus]|uniref:hypothetical protein n=1 Tax=Streptomyces collinus TaxID=42684 RepID=UPI0036CFD990